MCMPTIKTSLSGPFSYFLPNLHLSHPHNDMLITPSSKIYASPTYLLKNTEKFTNHMCTG